MADNKVQMSVTLNTRDAERKLEQLMHKQEQLQRAEERFNASVSRSGGATGNGNQANSVLSSTGDIKSLSTDLKGAFSELTTAIKQFEKKSYNLRDPKQAEALKSDFSQRSNLTELSDRIVKQLAIATRQTSGTNGSSESEVVRQIARMQHEGQITKASSGPGTADQRVSAYTSKQNSKREFNSLASELRDIVNRTKGTSKSLNTAFGSGHITYEKTQDLNTRNTDDSKSLAKLSNLLDNRRSVVNAQYEAANKKALASEGTTSHEANVDEAVRLGKLSSDLDELSKTLKETNRTMERNKSRLDNGLENGEIQQSAKRGSFRDVMQSRAFAISANVGNQIRSGASSTYSGGQQLRMAAQPNIDSITLANAVGGNYTKRGDNKLLKDLATQGIRNGTGYNATSMAQFAGSYSQNSGNTNLSDIKGVTGSASELSRFTGFGEDTTNQLLSSLGEGGAIGSSAQMKQIQSVVQGEIQNSGMQGRSVQQGQALSSIFSNMISSGQSISTSDATNMAGVQGILAKNGGSTFQGAQGAQAINAIGNGVANGGFQNAVMRGAWANGDPKYSGAHGMAQLQLDMKEPLKAKNAGHLNDMFQNISRMNGNDPVRTAAMLQQQMPELSSEQAEKFAKMSANGKLSPDAIKKELKKDGTDGKTGTQHLKKQFSTQGDSTLDISVAVNDRGQISVNQVGDSARGGKNGILGGASGFMSGLLGVGGSAVGAIGQGVANVGVSALFKKFLGGGGKHAAGGLVSKVTGGLFGGGSKGGKHGGGFSLFGKSGRAAETAAKDVAETGSRVSRTAKVAKGAGILGGIGGMLKGGVKTVAKKGSGLFGGLVKGVSKFAGNGIVKGGAKLLGKGGSKAIPFLGEALMAADAVGGVVDISKDPMNALKHPIKSLGSLLGFGSVNGDDTAKADAKKKDKNKDSKSPSGGGSKTSSGNKSPAQVADQADNWVVQFNRTLDKAQRLIEEAKGIKLGTDGDSDSGGSGKSGGSGSVSGVVKSKNSKKTMASIAKQVGKATGIDPRYVFGQMMFETGGGSSVSSKDNNYSGITWNSSMKGTKGLSKGSSRGSEGGNYVHFDSVDDYASYYAKMLSKSYGGLKDAKSYNEAAQYLKQKGYYTSNNVGAYANGMRQYGNQYSQYSKHATGGIFSTPHVGMVAEAGTEAVVPFAPSRRNEAKSILRRANSAVGMNLDINSQNQTGGSFSYAPTHSVTITNADGSDTSELKQQLQSLIANMQSRDQAQAMSKFQNFAGKSYSFG
ncbi:hypothetical protein GPK34_00780 [Secundilactobacillus kimchicus]|uniref:glucosaminidase domain-containing protein n=1 Tax=Secundilactobacillus kimchicus TaxID=528209 RepID=UPI001C0312F7|nr:glucosaminidase domain-containing protein [Secundilactobacillus kimchicus]MBT9670573.1 hypothetical protein [Secundilactobacillus kimchicus]